MISLDFEWQINEFMVYCRSTQSREKSMARYEQALIVRFKITDDTYETVVTNLEPYKFPAKELKKLYNMPRGIETSFWSLKYTVGLLHFHVKKLKLSFAEAVLAK